MRRPDCDPSSSCILQRATASARAQRASATACQERRHTPGSVVPSGRCFGLRAPTKASAGTPAGATTGTRPRSRALPSGMERPGIVRQAARSEGATLELGGLRSGVQAFTGLQRFACRDERAPALRNPCRQRPANAAVLSFERRPGGSASAYRRVRPPVPKARRRFGGAVWPRRSGWWCCVQRRRSYGISRTVIRFVAPEDPVRRPAVSTTRAPLGRPADSLLLISAASISSSTEPVTAIVNG